MKTTNVASGGGSAGAEGGNGIGCGSGTIPKCEVSGCVGGESWIVCARLSIKSKESDNHWCVSVSVPPHAEQRTSPTAPPSGLRAAPLGPHALAAPGNLNLGCNYYLIQTIYQLLLFN